MAYTVLVIDGDRDSRELLQLVLSHRGHEVLVADTAAAGLSLARSATPTGVITEFLVPARGGLCVVEALRSRRETRKLPVIVWTATALPEVRARVEKAGALFRMKPARPLELALELEDLLRSRAAAGRRRGRGGQAVARTLASATTGEWMEIERVLGAGLREHCRSLGLREGEPLRCREATPQQVWLEKGDGGVVVLEREQAEHVEVKPARSTPATGDATEGERRPRRRRGR